MLQLSIVPGGDGCRWRLTRLTPRGADVLAVGCQPYPDEASCHATAARLARSAPESMSVAQRPDGYWAWRIVDDEDGRPLAASPATYPDATSCGRALTYLRHELGVLVPG